MKAEIPRHEYRPSSEEERRRTEADRNRVRLVDWAYKRLFLPEPRRVF